MGRTVTRVVLALQVAVLLACLAAGEQLKLSAQECETVKSVAEDELRLIHRNGRQKLITGMVFACVISLSFLIVCLCRFGQGAWLVFLALVCGMLVALSLLAFDLDSKSEVEQILDVSNGDVGDVLSVCAGVLKDDALKNVDLGAVLKSPVWAAVGDFFYYIAIMYAFWLIWLGGTTLVLCLIGCCNEPSSCLSLKRVRDALFHRHQSSSEERTVLSPSLAKLCTKMHLMRSTKTRRTPASSVGSDDDESKDVCSICCEGTSGSRIMELSCSHRFHSDCMNRWVLVFRGKDCPLCRAPV